MNLELIKKEAESFAKKHDLPYYLLAEFAKHCVDKATGWRPIESAPKDGTYVIVHIPNYRGVRIAWNHSGVWIDDERGIEINPTHFMNITKPPGAA
jgi:hypothetical protein